MDKNKFLEKATQKHGTKYDYSKTNTEFVHNLTTIICPEHGEFQQTPSKHYGGQGCNKCSTKRANNIIIKKASDTFVEKANIKHDNRYNYDKVIYTNAKETVIITCPQHGDFPQKPYHHLQGSGCSKCGNIKSEKAKVVDKEYYIREWTKVHGDKYTYNNVIYISSDEYVQITCKEHGDFPQRPNNHLGGQGCPKCRGIISKVEIEIHEFLKQYVEIETNNRTILNNGKELDIYIPSKNIAIEFNGLYFHSEKFKDKDYHIDKTKQAIHKNIKLIHIFEDEWRDKKEIVKSRLLNLIGETSNKIYARKCELRIIDSKTSAHFLKDNHIQGDVTSSIKLGLFNDDILVSVMTFGGLRKSLGQSKKEGKFELLRFCNKLNTSVVGGASKLLKFFESKYKPEEIISYADLRWSSGSIYNKLNFNYSHTSEPNYFYTKGNIREGRFGYRKDILVSQGFNKNLTEREIMKERGFLRVYDCGTLVYKKVYN